MTATREGYSGGLSFVDNSGFGVGLIITGPEGNPVPGDVTQNVAGPLRVNTYYSNDQNQPSITLLPGDKLLVTWTSYAQDADNEKGIFGQIMDADGNHVGPEFHVNQTHARPDRQYLGRARDWRGSDRLGL